MNSKVIICRGINLDKSYKNVLSYSESDMLNLCMSKSVYSNNTYNFIKHGVNSLEVSASYSTCLTCNYMAFQNPDFNNKWFFAFIDKIEYRNNGTTRIYYTVDVFHTWFDYWDVKPCFVLREHTNDDTIGYNTVPEGLETGEFVASGCGDITDKLNLTYTCIGTSWLPDNTPFYTQNRVFGGVYSGVSYLLFKTIESAAKFIRAIDELGRNSSATIICIWEIPQALTGISGDDANWFTANLGDETGITAHTLPNVLATTLESNLSISSPSTLDGYTPKNNKMFTGEFNKLMITNNAGQQVEYNYEDFINNSPLFDLVGTVTPSASIMLVPVNYKKTNFTKAGYNYGLSIAKYPMGSWNSDLYTNWMTSNGINIFGHKIDAPTYQALGGALETIGGIMMASQGLKGGYDKETEAGGSMIGGGVGKMFNAVQSNYQHSLMPHAVGGQLNSGDLTFAYRKMSPTYYKMTPRGEMAARCDDFLSRFGYKTNRIKIPNQLGRTYFNFVQIGDTENIGYPNNNGSVPQDAMNLINNIYRNGVTIWHSHDNIGNYSLINTIVTP